MKISVKVKTNKKETKITKIEDNIYYLDVKSQPIKNKANLEVIKFFSKRFKGKVKIVKGLKSKTKILELE